MDLVTSLLKRLDDSRANLLSIFPRVDRKLEIYPHWTLKQVLDHITGWDDAVIAALASHRDGLKPATPADQGINLYNTSSIASRADLDYEHSFLEFNESRGRLRDLILKLPENKLAEPLITPWGAPGTVSEIVEIFAEHEESHAGDLLRWPEDPCCFIREEPEK